MFARLISGNITLEFIGDSNSHYLHVPSKLFCAFCAHVTILLTHIFWMI